MSDAVAVMPMITDATTMKYTSGVVPDDREAAERWLSARALGKDVLNFVIMLKNDGQQENEEIVGIMGSYHWPEIGYLMNPGEILHQFFPFFCRWYRYTSIIMAHPSSFFVHSPLVYLNAPPISPPLSTLTDRNQPDQY